MTARHRPSPRRSDVRPERLGQRSRCVGARLLAQLMVALSLALAGAAPIAAQEQAGEQAQAQPQPQPDGTLEGGVVEGEPGDEIEDDGLPRVVLAAFTTEISDREPVDDVTFLGSDKRVVYFFTDLRNMQGQTVRHEWKYEGADMGTVNFEVKGARWRVWSSKQLLPVWLGTWTVSVLNPEGEVLATESFTFQEGP